jgi:RNA polymerase sigma-70 factor (ECF subfamily)
MQRDLVERAQAGDHDAFTLLVRESLPRAYRVAKLILREEDRAQDAVQEAFVAAWRDVRALRNPDAWESWLHRLVVRACYRSAHAVRRRSVVELHVTPDVEPARAADELETIADRDQVEGALERLPIDQRTVAVLHFYLDLPLTEVAAIVGIPVGTAKSRLHRGLEALRRDIVRDRPTSTTAPREPSA